jgi:amino acid adenylation domain-containing protein
MHPITFSPDESANLAPPAAAKSLPEPLRTWCGTQTEYPRSSTVSSIFEEIAGLHPDSIALVQDDIHLTYKDLNQRANRLAYRLQQLGVKPDTLVGCCFERSIDMIVAMLAILKAGGAYVPLESAYPQARLRLILEDVGRPLIVSRKSLASVLFTQDFDRVVLLDDESDRPSTEVGQQNPGTVAGPRSLAYVMYTSGSTGRPKGVMVEHRGILRLVRETNYCRFGREETFLQFAPMSFDASTFEIWGALLNGGRLVIMPPTSSSLADLVGAIRKYGVTTLWLTAGLFHVMVEEHPEGLQTLRQLLAGGDVLSPSHVRRFLEQAPSTTLINGYGPTENTTFTCCHAMHAGVSLPESIPIGKPISNTRVYLLDENRNPVSPGEIGELYTSGDGVARGYLNDPEATAAKFLFDPFAKEPNERMYRTGDLARWRPDGTLEFLRRVDNQVKILGYRIEPAEIETALQRHEQVKQACVVARSENGSKRLAAYFVPSNSGPTVDELRDFAALQLPQHMVPAFFIALPSLPLSANGKVDRAALSQLRIVSKQEVVKPDNARTEVEHVLVDLWKRVLNVPAVGLDDNFFDLGGDSLLLVAVHFNLQNSMQIEIPVTDLFEFTTIRKLANHLGHAESKSPTFSDTDERAQRQRKAFTRFRGRTSGGGS